MRAQEGAHHPHGHALRGAADDAQVAQLLVQRQPVARLALDRRRPAGERGSEAGLDQALEGGVVGGARLAHGAQDSALGIGRALEARGCLVRSVAGEDGMGVAVDQAGRDERGSELDPIVIGWGVARMADPCDAAVTHDERPWRETGGRQTAGAGQEHWLSECGRA